MKFKDFDKLLDGILETVKVVLASKSSEYARDSDKLYNFKRAGERLRRIPEEALMGMAEKHYTSIIDIVEKIAEENKKVGLHFIARPPFLTRKILDEKIIDGINYLILLDALIKERYGWK